MSNNNKNEVITRRVSKELKDSIKQNANDCNLNTSEFITSAISDKLADRTSSIPYSYKLADSIVKLSDKINSDTLNNTSEIAELLKNINNSICSINKER